MRGSAQCAPEAHEKFSDQIFILVRYPPWKNLAITYGFDNKNILDLLGPGYHYFTDFYEFLHLVKYLTYKTKVMGLRGYVRYIGVPIVS